MVWKVGNNRPHEDFLQRLETPKEKQTVVTQVQRLCMGMSMSTIGGMLRWVSRDVAVGMTMLGLSWYGRVAAPKIGAFKCGVRGSTQHEKGVLK